MNPDPLVSISTAWNYHSQMDIRQWCLQVEALGLNTIALDYQLTSSHLDELERILPDLGMGVSSVHNFCPLPNDPVEGRHASNYYRLSSPDETERRKAVAWTKNTIETACRFQAGVVVIHAGTMGVGEDKSGRLLDLYRQGQKESPEFSRLKAEILAARAQGKAPFIDALNKSLEEVIACALEKGVVIGLENRYYPFEVPNFDEVGEFLKRFQSENLKYWHDTGHAEINERLGFSSHKDFLTCYKDRMAGIHLHGMKGTKDHLTPFIGDLDMAPILKALGCGSSYSY